MLSIMNEIDSYLLLLLCVLYEIQNQIYQHGSQYVTNQFNVRIQVLGILTNLRKMLAAKFFSSSHDEDHKALWLQNLTVYKHSSFFTRKMN